MEPLGNILPIYFVADESYSMSPHVGELNDGLSSLLDALHLQPMGAAKVRFCMIGFSDFAECHLEPADLRYVEVMPQLSARGSTSYTAAFRELRSRIPHDIAQLKADGYLVNRPAVFFLTDGAPNPGDGWEQAHAELVGPEFGQRPNILAFGIGDAVQQVIREVATTPEYAFVAAAGTYTGVAVAEFAKALTRSVISSAQALADGDSSLPVEKPEGFISLSVDPM